MAQGMWEPSDRVKQRQLDEAKRFYRADQQVSDEDRVAMAGFFRQRSTLFPLLCVPITIGSAMLPGYLKKRGILPKNKSTRFLQTCLAFTGLFAGIKISGGLATFLHTKKLHSDSAVESYHILTRYPPQLGSTYYSLTARNKAVRFNDPSTIDWKTTPMFPLALVMNSDVVKTIKQQQSQAIAKYEQDQKDLTKLRIEGIEPKEIPLTGSSWDGIIEKTNSERAEEQQFQTPTDDFTDSEKKW